MTDKPINETEYNRIELPENFQKVFTGLLSSGGQIVVDHTLRSGKATSPDYQIPIGAKVEVKLIAIHYPQV